MPHRPSDLHPFLERLLTRSVLTAEERCAVLDLPTRADQVSANRDFVHLDQTLQHSCIVVKGLVGRFGQTSQGARQITALHIAGDAPDLHSVVQPKAGSALQALTTTTIVRVPHAALRAVAARYPAIAEAFWRDSVVDAAVLSQWVVNVGRRDARTRMAHLLCEMASRFKARLTDNRASFPFPITQVHLADATGLTPVHVNRTLKCLKELGLMTMNRQWVQISDWKALARMGEFHAGYLQIDIKPEERLRIAVPA